MFVAPHNPCCTGGIEQVLGAQNICVEEELGIFDASVNMALGGKIYDHVEAVFGKEAVDERSVADISLHEEAAVVVDVFGNGSQVACIGKQVQNNDAHIVVFAQDVLDIIGADKAGGSGN